MISTDSRISPDRAKRLLARPGGATRRKRWLAVAALAAAWVLPAQGEEKVIQEPDKTVVRKKTLIDFTDVAVEGELSKPEGSYVLDQNRTRFRSLVKVRENFVPELQKSVDNL